MYKNQKQKKIIKLKKKKISVNSSKTIDFSKNKQQNVVIKKKRYYPNNKRQKYYFHSFNSYYKKEKIRKYKSFFHILKILNYLKKKKVFIKFDQKKFNMFLFYKKKKMVFDKNKNKFNSLLKVKIKKKITFKNLNLFLFKKRRKLFKYSKFLIFYTKIKLLWKKINKSKQFLYQLENKQFFYFNFQFFWNKKIRYKLLKNLVLNKSKKKKKLFKFLSRYKLNLMPYKIKNSLKPILLNTNDFEIYQNTNKNIKYTLNVTRIKENNLTRFFENKKKLFFFYKPLRKKINFYVFKRKHFYFLKKNNLIFFKNIYTNFLNANYFLIWHDVLPKYTFMNFFFVRFPASEKRNIKKRYKAQYFKDVLYQSVFKIKRKKKKLIVLNNATLKFLKTLKKKKLFNNFFFFKYLKRFVLNKKYVQIVKKNQLFVVGNSFIKTLKVLKKNKSTLKKKSYKKWFVTFFKFFFLLNKKKKKRFLFIQKNLRTFNQLDQTLISNLFSFFNKILNTKFLKRFYFFVFFKIHFFLQSYFTNYLLKNIKNKFLTWFCFFFVKTFLL